MFDLINSRILQRDQRPLRQRIIDHPAATAVVLLTLLIVALTSLAIVTMGRPQPFAWEETVFWAIHSWPESLTPLFAVLTDGATLGALILASGVALLAKRRRIALAIFTSGGTAWVTAHVFKSLLERGRPEYFFGSEIVRYGSLTDGYGVPSGHAAVAAGLAMALGMILPRRWAPVIILVAFLVGVSRIYLGVHLPLDVVAGWSIGVVAGYGCVLLLGVDKRWKVRGSQESE